MAILNKARMRSTLLRKLSQLILIACVVGIYYGFYLNGHPYARWFAIVMTAPAIAMAGYTQWLYLRRQRDEEAARQRIVAWQRRMNAAVRLRSKRQAVMEIQRHPANLRAD